MNVLAWVGIGFMIAYALLIATATILKSLKNEREKVNLVKTRVMDRDIELNPSLETESLSEPLSAYQ